MHSTTSPLMGSTEAAHLLGIDKSTLTRWVESGRIKAAGRVSDRKNGAFIFDRTEVERVKSEQAAA